MNARAVRFYVYRGEGPTAFEEAIVDRHAGGRPRGGAHGKRARYDAGCRCGACEAGHEARLARDRARPKTPGNTPHLW